MARNRNRRLNRRILLKETKRLHDMSVGESHCDPRHLDDCAAYQMLVPQAAENIEKGRAADETRGLPRV